MAMPGPYREDRDQLLFVTELSGWQNFPIKKALTEGFDIPIYITNDANASAFAQLWYRSKEYGIRNMIYVLAGQGIGCGIITDGKLVLGQRGIAASLVTTPSIIAVPPVNVATVVVWKSIAHFWCFVRTSPAAYRQENPLSWMKIA